MCHHSRSLGLLIYLLGFLVPAQGQWLTQTFQLRAGWNAIYLHVDASHATLDELIGANAPVPTPIVEVWRWNSGSSSIQFLDSPQQPLDPGTQWTSWRRDEEDNDLRRLAGNVPYLVYATENYEWRLKGAPVLPTYRWSTSGLNFLGFSTVSSNAPTFDAFLTNLPSLGETRIYRYSTNALDTTNPSQLSATMTATTVVRRGEAFWIDAGREFTHYFGPFTLVTSGSGRVAFGDSLSVQAFRIRNHLDAPLAVSLRLAPSEASPPGLPPIAGVPPLLLRGSLNLTNLTYTYSALTVSSSVEWNLAPAGQAGSDIEVILGLDRSAITASPGQRLAGTLQFTDSLGHTRVDMGVSAEAASNAGLWVGSAAVTNVGQYLRTYLRDASNQLVIQADGKYVVTDLITNLTPVPRPFPLRLLVHNPASGPATLLQRVYFGFNELTNPIVATHESALARNLLSHARRLSAVHLPWSADNLGWAFSEALAPGRTIATTVTTSFDDHASNPFLHTYHPDHDNLDARFAREAAQGEESYSITRQITLSVRPPGDDFDSRVTSGLKLLGEYVETVEVAGLARGGGGRDTRRLDARGVFELTRATDVPTLTRAP